MIASFCSVEMQEIHSIAGGSRLFGGGDRRLRPNLHHQIHHALKCPRCDSLNTKFCYYNNYNLSQPRHFCKDCRRYWTKGGVLRNVPVGGGCRKTKHSSKSKSKSKSISNSSSDSSSLTAASAAAVSAPTTAPISDGGVFSEIGSFASLISPSNDTLPFGFGNIAADVSQFPMNDQFPANQWAAEQRMMDVSNELKMQEITGGAYIDQTANVDPSGNSRSSNVGFEPLDWQSNGDHQALFDLPSAVDQAYWSQNEWTDQDQQNLYHP